MIHWRWTRSWRGLITLIHRNLEILRFTPSSPACHWIIYSLAFSQPAALPTSASSTEISAACVPDITTTLVAEGGLLGAAGLAAPIIEDVRLEIISIVEMAWRGQRNIVCDRINDNYEIINFNSNQLLDVNRPIGIIDSITYYKNLSALGIKDAMIDGL
jgi:hypothetical protein